MKNVIIVIIVLLVMFVLASFTVKNHREKALAANLTMDNRLSMTKEHTELKTMKSTTAVRGTQVPVNSKSIVINHANIQIDKIPLKWIDKAKKELHIAYGHTSHGSQITSGLLALTNFKKSPFIYIKGAPKDSLDLRDNPFITQMDLGTPNNKAWAPVTRKYLEKNKDINVVMWSWCGQLSKASQGYVNTYLSLMQEMEKQYPQITFVYMTGHLDGTGEKKTLAKNNNHIREFCIRNDKVLYDFADIESYNPDGVYFGDKNANDACAYDSDGDGKPDKNWAKEWQDRHKVGVDWYQCTAAHSQPVNANMKAYAAWWLMARIAGWDGISEVEDLEE